VGRKMADCRRFESESECSLTIIGDEHEVMEASVAHAVSVHGHEDSPETRAQLRALLEDESAFVPGVRAKEPFPA
jgi:Protein of unknown function (DUF1059)